ncbi:hypothetical protein OESDEN_15454 [Oesophagostomum dentatum]|uniref:Sodium:neurotransmitter symporter family protein n=1 Tax=Oesophagostomum dentatum TaxID=61180 RepID=A0A0B1SMR4_OESDE|nr:hypothetical protein OESDEN_15454 [Oesophagostomum dentatum]
MVFGVSAEATGKKLKLFVNIVALVFWAVVIPFAVAVCVIALTYYSVYIGMLEIYEWILIGALLVPVPALCAYLVYRQHAQGNMLDTLFKRNPDLWGPRSRANRYEAERAERMIRKWF